MTDLNIRLRTEADDPQLIAIRNEANPHFPPISLEEYRYSADPANNAPGIQERFVIERGETILGLYVFNEMTFVERPDTFAANIGVAKDERCKGIGTCLYEHMMGRAKTHGATRIYGSISDDSDESFQFFEHRGFTKSGRANRMSRLLVDEANMEGYDGVLEKVESSGITFKTLTEIGLDDEPMLRKVHHMAFKSARDIPSSEEFNEVPFETWKKWMNAPGNSPDQTWVALDGDTPAGVATIGRRGDDAAFNNYTGVARGYRGRGIARALKVITIDWARNNGVKAIFTGNDVDNERMLSINIPLGYKAVPSQVEVVKDVEEGKG